LKVSSCKELKSEDDCTKQGNYYTLEHDESNCIGDRMGLYTVIDLSGSAYTRENCEAACNAADPEDCQQYMIDSTTDAGKCVLFAGACDKSGATVANSQIYRKNQSCYWTVPTLIYTNSECGN